MQILDKSFYQQKTLEVTRDLIGKLIIVNSNGSKIVAKIVETEAYTENDPACHANKGMTPRNEIMFGPGGYAYVYFSYGNHWLLNFVTGKEGVGEAVLIRAVEPVEGLDVMRKNRLPAYAKATARQGRPKVIRKIDLTNGPGKLAQALGITKGYYGMDLTSKQFHVSSNGEKSGRIITTTRIGISQGCDLPYRFYLKDNPYVSKK
ncbi:MAG: DNA-3-methyladenine glycosylase [Actinobacteria bacterium]|nr:MAG: DNA-3-methyladenine glycosylase [Actinomycetota bacterium]